MNEGGGGGGGGGARLLPSRQQGRKWREEVGFNQTLSRSVSSEWASPPGRSFTETMLTAGGLAAVHAGRGPSRHKSITTMIHVAAPLLSCKFQRVKVMPSGAQREFGYKSTYQVLPPSLMWISLFCISQQLLT